MPVSAQLIPHGNVYVGAAYSNSRVVITKYDFKGWNASAEIIPLSRISFLGLVIDGSGFYRPGITDAPSPLLEENIWDRTINVNLKGTFLCCKHVLPPMMEAGGGRIINFSSNAGRTSSPALGCHYTAAKAGVLGLTRHLAKEYASHKILVNTVAPGPARVERNFEILSDEARARLLADMPLGRFAEPSDLSAVVRFLVSDGGQFITGATIDVNGGYVMV